MDWLSLLAPKTSSVSALCKALIRAGGFFTVELKVSKGNKLTFSPHQIAFHIKHPTNTFILAEHHEQRAIKLYEGSAIQELAARGLELDACCLGLDALEERLLLGA